MFVISTIHDVGNCALNPWIDQSDEYTTKLENAKAYIKRTLDGWDDDEQAPLGFIVLDTEQMVTYTYKVKETIQKRMLTVEGLSDD